MSRIEEAEGKAIMVQGTSSNVGKTLFAAGLCRILHQDGLSVAPFKAMNMALNSHITEEGLEMGTGQYIQAEAAGIIPMADMNPVLIKPERGGKSQVIIRGKVSTIPFSEHWQAATESYDRLRSQYGVVVIEGAGSPAEPNLMESDLANLRVAKYANAPILLVGDIDRGGVFASLEGTMSILHRHDPEGASLVKAFVLNKFRGEKKYIEPAISELTTVTNIPVLGVVPFMHDHRIADEDTVDLERRSTEKENAVIDAAVLHTPSLQNSHDFDPLITTPGVNVRFVSRIDEFGTPDVVFLAGSKGTISDLKWLRQKGFEELIKGHADEGNAVIGICGGFQMLGRKILDPNHVESTESEVDGLGLLPTVTTFESEKVTRQAKGKVTNNQGLLKGVKDAEIAGYEIHMGRTEVEGIPIANIIRSGDETEIPEGASDTSGWVIGTYLHDFLRNDKVRSMLLHNIAERKGVSLPDSEIMKPGIEYDLLANTIRENIDMELLYKILNRKV